MTQFDKIQWHRLLDAQETYIASVFYDTVRGGDRLFLYPNIPPQKWESASLMIPYSYRATVCVLGVADSGTVGVKDGLVFTTEGLYGKQGLTRIAFFRPYADIDANSVAISHSNVGFWSWKLRIHGEGILNRRISNVEIDQIGAFLVEIARNLPAVIRAGTSKPEADSLNTPRWHRPLDERETYIAKTFRDKVRAEERTFLFPHIPPAKMQSAFDMIPLADRKKCCVLGIVDDTVMRGCKDGLVLTTDGVYWKQLGQRPGFRRYEEISPRSIEVRRGAFTRALIVGGIRLLANRLTDAALDQLGAFLLEVTSYLSDGLPKAAKSQDSVPASAAHDLPQVAVPDVTRQDEKRVCPKCGSERRRGTTACGHGTCQDSTPYEECSVDGQAVADELDKARVDLNNAKPDDILGLPCMTLSFVEMIVTERERRLGFYDFEDIRVLLDLQPHQVENLKLRACLRLYQGVGPNPAARKRIVDF